jgi:hypothetical protein
MILLFAYAYSFKRMLWVIHLCLDFLDSIICVLTDFPLI